MSESLKPEDRDPMERYLDNLMSPEEAAEFLTQRQNDDSFIKERSLQHQIDASLKALFSFDVPEAVSVDSVSDQQEELVNESIRHENVGQSRVGSSRWLRLVLAASLLGIACWLGLQWAGSGSQVVFQPVPLAQVYLQNVEKGFTPYYECHDMQRFADTFEHRHGVALTLAEMPPGRGMLGLSYLGGVSRESTAMLCTVQQSPVLVFVDKLSNDRGQLLEDVEPELNIFRAEKFGLVFYEVTPLEESTMVQYFEIADNSPAND